MLRSGNLQVGRLLASSDDDMESLQNLVAYLNGGRAGEASPTMECRDTGLRECLFRVLRNWAGERPLETYQFLPIYLKLIGLNSAPLHSANPIDSFRSAHQNLLRVASPQRTRTAERP